MDICHHEDCTRPIFAKTRQECSIHYHQWRATQTPGPSRVRGTPEQMFWAKVDKRSANECWPWTGSIGKKGYGKAKFKGKWVAPHRFSYELHVGPIAPGLEIDHLCRNTGCVNPAHLEAVSPAENMRRRKEATTHCKRGHEFTPENTRFHSVTGSKVCRQCMRDYGREWAREKYQYKTKRV